MTVPPSLSQPDPPTRLPGDPFPCIPILEGIRDGFALLAIVVDAQGNPADARFLEVNKAFERFTGLRRADVAGRLASDLGAPSPLWGPELYPVALGGPSVHGEAFCPRADRTLAIQALCPAPGQVAVFFRDAQPCRDVHQQLQRQSRLQQAIARIFQAAMETATEADLAAYCLDVASRLTGSPVGFLGVLNGAGRLQILAVLHDLVPPGGPVREEVLARMADLPLSGFWAAVAQGDRCRRQEGPEPLPGHPYLLERQLGVALRQGVATLGVLGLANKAEAYEEADGETLETLAPIILAALTRKRMEASLLEANASLEMKRVEMQAAIEELDAFSYSVSHDLRAPLRHIVGFAELLRKELNGAPGDRADHFLETIQASGRHMGQLIDALLAFSQSGRLPIQKRRVDLAQVAADLVRALEPEVQGRRVTWEVGELPVVEADPVLMRSVLANLLANALKFTREREEAVIRLGSERRDGEALVFVTDNGAGFNPRNASRLFGVFQRLHAPARFEGTGIGLANVRRIILRHGGRVWATGEEGAGATFGFALPVPKGEAGP